MTSSATERHPKHQGQGLGKRKLSEPHGGWNVPECIPLEPSAGPLTVGRTSQADIFLSSPQHPAMLSRVHASLWFNSSTSQWNITDLESINGVFVNGKRVKSSTPVALENGTEICFGSVPRNELRYSLVTSCGDPHMLLRLGARQEERETVTTPEGEPKENTEPSPGLVKDTPTTSPREILYEQDSEQDSEVLLPPTKKPRVEEDVSLSGTGLALSSQSTKASSSSDEKDSQQNNTMKPSLASSSRETEMKGCSPDKESTTNSSQDKDNTAGSNSQSIPQDPPPTAVPQPPPSTTTTPSYLVSPLSHLETPASAIDELFSDGAVEKDFDEIVSDAIFGEDGSVVPSAAGPSSEATAVGTAGSRGYLDGASLQIQAARDDMQKEKQKWLSSIEALKSELASKEKLLAQKSEQEKEEEKRKKEGEGVIDSMQEEFTCAICQELFIEAHTLPCAHSFCKKCIREWMKSKRECPVCRKPMSADPIHSLVLDNAIDKMVEKMGPAAVEERRKLKDSRASADNAPRQSGGSGSSGRSSGFGGSSSGSSGRSSGFGGSSSGFGGSSSGSSGSSSGSGGSSSGSSGSSSGSGGSSSGSSGSSSGSGGSSSGSSGSSSGSGGSSSGTQSGSSGRGGGGRGSSGNGNSGGNRGGRGRRKGGGNGSGGQSGGNRGGGGHQHGGHRHYDNYYESDDYDDDEEEEGSDGSDDSYDSGLYGAYYGGYGRCFNCGSSGHWANGCPY